MSEKYISEENEHHKNDAAELDRLDTNAGNSSNAEVTETPRKNALPWIIAIAIIGVIGVVALALIVFKQSGKSEVKTEEVVNQKDNGEPREVKLSPEVLAAAGIATESVTQRPAVALLDVTGTVESDPQQTQAVSPLVAGRVEQVFVSIGDRVLAGQTLATIASTEITESYGKFHEAENRLDIARKTLLRVRRSENRVGVLQAKARLDEAEATLKRTRRLIELGAGAGKDLIAAETAFKTAQADYEFQRNITLNKEIQEAESEVKTAEIDVNHQKRSLLALGVNINANDEDARNMILVPLKAPLSGSVSERLINVGSGVQAGQQMFTLSNISSVWITANVPQQQLGSINIGMIAEVTTNKRRFNARVTYIDPTINEDTRTAKVRLAVDNPGERLRPGMFVEVGFQTGSDAATGEDLVVNSEAIQRLGEKNVVFVPREDESGAFEVREIEAGADIDGYTKVISGLKLGEKVVTKGSFTLKTQLEKGAMGDED